MSATTHKLTVITGMGNSLESRIFTGAFGQLRDDGALSVDPILTKLISLSAFSGGDGQRQMQTIEVDDGCLVALKATLFAAMGRRWEAAYLGGTSSVRRDAAEAVKNMVAVTLAETREPAYFVDVEKRFEPVLTRAQSGSMDAYLDVDDGDNFATQISFRAQDFLSGAASAWVVREAAQPVILGADGLPRTASESDRVYCPDDAQYIRGTVTCTAVVYGRDAQVRSAVFNAISQLPSTIQNEILLCDTARFSRVEWQSKQDLKDSIRSRLEAGEEATPQEIAFLAPDWIPESSRSLWVDGFKLGRKLGARPGQDDRPVDLEEATQGLEVPRM